MPDITIDSEFERLEFSPTCFFCKHLRERRADDRCCAAFPARGSIPLEIWNGDNNHTKPVEGDGGFMFEDSRVKTETSKE